MSQIQTILEKIQGNLKNSQGTTEELNEYDCPECKDKEVIIAELDGDWVMRECKCKPKKKMRRLLKASGLTESLREFTFNNLDPRPKQKEMYEEAYNYVKNYPEIKGQKCNGLAFTGTVGVGKTHLMAAIANNLLAKGISVCFVNTPVLIKELRKSQFEDSNKVEEQLEIISNAEVAIFDDLAKEKSTEWVQTQYYTIANNRYIKRLPTLFSTNCDIDELEDKLGDATASRLYAMTKDRLIHVVDDDYRMIE